MQNKVQKRFQKIKNISSRWIIIFFKSTLFCSAKVQTAKQSANCKTKCKLQNKVQTAKQSANCKAKCKLQNKVQTAKQSANCKTKCKPSSIIRYLQQMDNYFFSNPLCFAVQKCKLQNKVQKRFKKKSKISPADG